MASQAKKPIKGILKKPKKTTSADPQPNIAPASTQPDPRAVALHHARLLEDRKAIESAIFDNILTLLDYPLHPSRAPASSPHPSDVEGFTSLVRIFQPSDYDDLVVERNLSDDRCGYALCPNQRRRFRGAGTYKLVNKGRKDFDIVPTAELEKWCSTECTRRALWVKVQLNETAAWERVGLPELRIELYPEGEKDGGRRAQPTSAGEEDEGKAGTGEPERLATDMARVQLEHDRKAARDTAALALERGDDAKDLATRSFDVVIREKTVTTKTEAPSLGDDLAKEDTIEGYKVKFGADAEESQVGNEPEEDLDWII